MVYFDSCWFRLQSDAEIDKENLKELVSKWNENPNNRYSFEQDTENVISPSGETIQIRRPDAGSRRGSLIRGKSEGLWFNAIHALQHLKHTHTHPNTHSNLKMYNPFPDWKMLSNISCERCFAKTKLCSQPNEANTEDRRTERDERTN